MKEIYLKGLFFMKSGLCCPLVQNLSNLLFLTIIVAKKHLGNFLKSIAFRHEVGLETVKFSAGLIAPESVLC